MKKIRLSYNESAFADAAPASERAVATWGGEEKHAAESDEGKLASVYRRESQPLLDCEIFRRRGVRTKPYDFQNAFVSFASANKKVLCCDDMGLGKTFQVLATLRLDPPSKRFLVDAARAGRYRGNTLVICPKIVLRQWASEYAAHLSERAGGVLVYHPSQRTQDTPIEDLCRFEVVVTTYDYMRSSASLRAASELLSIQWWRIVLDEAHLLKNIESKRFLVIDALESSRRIALSGTPIQNNRNDLFGVLRFLRVEGLTGPIQQAHRHWIKTFEAPFEGADEKARRRATECLMKLLKTIVVRRMKTGVWRGRSLIHNLPAKSRKVVTVGMTKEEEEVYDKIVSAYLSSTTAMSKAGDVLKGAGEAHAFAKMSAMRLCCVTPSFCLDTTGRDQFADAVCSACFQGETQAALLGCGCVLCTDCDDGTKQCPVCKKQAGGRVQIARNEPRKRSKNSAKLSALKSVLERTPAGDKVIVFSNWVVALDAIEEHAIPPGKTFLRLDGRLNQKERDNVVASFKDDPQRTILLMSLGAGSTGIDLKVANHVVFLDGHWNPAIEAQAEDRVFRIGQKKAVQITRLLAAKQTGRTIEQIIHAVQKMKSKQLDTFFPTKNKDVTRSALVVQALKQSV